MKIWKYILTRAGDAPVTLTHIPAGWEDKTISFIRHEFYNSVLRSMSLSLRFIFEGKDLLITAYDEDGIFADVTVQIQRYNGLTDTYADYFTGIVDFSKAKITRDYFEAPIIDNQILAKFISRDEIEMNVKNLKTLDDESITDFAGGFEKLAEISGVDIITQSYKSLREEETIVYTGENFDFDSPETFPALTSFTYTISENPNNETVDKTTFKLYTNNSDAPINIELLFQLRITGTMSVLGGNSADVYLKAWVYTDDFPTPEYLIDFSETGLVGDQTVNIDESEVPIYTGFELNVNSSIYIKMQAGATDTIKSGTTSCNLEVQDFDVDIREVLPSWTFIDRNVFLPHELLNRLLQKTTDPDSVLVSDIIGRTDISYAADGEFAYHSVCNGYMIRNYSLSNKPFSTSIRSLFKSLNAITPVGLWYNETLDQWELKPIADYYRNEGIIELGEVKDFERFVDEKYYFNSIKSGYSKNISYEKKGINNFNCSFEFSSNIFPVKNIKDFQSEYRADDYGIMYLGIDTDLTKENNADNDIFWVVLDSSLETVTGADFYEVTELLNGSDRLNLDITPKRNLLRHIQELASGFWKQSTGEIKYQKSQYNQALTTKKTSVTAIIDELDDVSLLTDEPLYDPEIYNFTAPVTTDQIAQLMSDPHGYITFYYLGVAYYGYVLEISTEPFDRGGNWTLIKANMQRDTYYLTDDALSPLTDDGLELIIL